MDGSWLYATLQYKKRGKSVVRINVWAKTDLRVIRKYKRWQQLRQMAGI
jgi:hypothetical protein